MRDIRMFMRGNKLFVYDRASARRGNHTPVVVLEKPNGGYVMRKGYLEGSYVRNTDKLEQEIYKKMQTSGELVKIDKDKVAMEMQQFLSANSDQIGIALSVFQDEESSKVDKIMKDVLSLSPKERSELLVAILDIM